MVICATAVAIAVNASTDIFKAGCLSNKRYIDAPLVKFYLGQIGYLLIMNYNENK